MLFTEYLIFLIKCQYKYPSCLGGGKKKSFPTLPWLVKVNNSTAESVSQADTNAFHLSSEITKDDRFTQP